MLNRLILKNIPGQNDIDIELKGSVISVNWCRGSYLFDSLVFVSNFMKISMNSLAWVKYERSNNWNIDDKDISTFLVEITTDQSIEYKYEITWNKSSIISETIYKNEKLYITRSRLFDDDIPFFGPSWNEKDSDVDLVLETYSLYSLGWGFFNYLLDITKAGIEIKSYLRENLLCSYIENLITNSYTFNGRFTVDDVIHILKQNFIILSDKNKEKFYDIYNKIFPVLDFHVSIKNNCIEKNSIISHYYIDEMGSGFLRLCFILPLYYYSVTNKNCILYIPDMRNCLHENLYKYLVNFWEDNGVGQLIICNYQ